MINVDTVLQFEDIIARKKGLGIPIQPFIVIIGQLHEPKDIIVYFDDIKYKVLTIQRAVDVVFKLFHTFNLLYPDESYILWLFLQKFFYNIHIKGVQPDPRGHAATRDGCRFNLQLAEGAKEMPRDTGRELQASAQKDGFLRASVHQG
eukprot:XP_016657069.1 PREDICTED: uncharacterized protein LOC107882743 [Acyrthosiphon pisum]